jgi:FkbM family methyltransferase
VGAVRLVPADSLVLSQLYWQGQAGWEPQVVQAWRYFCRRANRVLELGANVGYFTVQGASAAPHVRYVAVEPHPLSVAVCRANLELNDVHCVSLVAAAAAVDASAATVPLTVPADQLATPTVAYLGDGGELPAAMTAPVGQVLQVPAVDVRSLVAGVDLLKLDVEGQEEALLSAVRGYLADRRPTVFVEVLPGTVRLRALLGELCERDGYRCYALAAAGLVLLTTDQLGRANLRAEYGNHDVILTTEPPPDLAALASA